MARTGILNTSEVYFLTRLDIYITQRKLADCLGEAESHYCHCVECCLFVGKVERKFDISSERWLVTDKSDFETLMVDGMVRAWRIRPALLNIKWF